MEITSVKIHKTDDGESRYKGRATVTIDDCFMIHNIRIYEANGEFKLQMPNHKLPDGHWSDYCHPLNEETRKYFESKIFDEYNNPSSEEEE